MDSVAFYHGAKFNKLQALMLDGQLRTLSHKHSARFKDKRVRAGLRKLGYNPFDFEKEYAREPTGSDAMTHLTGWASAEACIAFAVLWGKRFAFDSYLAFMPVVCLPLARLYEMWERAQARVKIKTQDAR